LRYGSWLVITFYSFNPLQMSIERKKKKQKQRRDVSFVFRKNKNPLLAIKRLRFFLAYLFINLVVTDQSFYKF
jgi:hypothetical protein